MALQSLELGLTLGLGLVSQRSFSYSGDVATDLNVSRPAEEERNCSPGSPASSGSGSRSKRAERSPGSGDEDEDGGGGGRGKKLRLSKDQAAVLEECFKTHSTLNPKQKAALASRLGLRPRQVEVWFQNRRARTKLKQTEVDCEYMKRWCEQLADQNRRLEKELADLRALKAAPLLTALTMCMSCRRVASSSLSSSSSLHSAGHGSTPSPVGLPVPVHRQFFCGGYREAGAATAYGSGSSSGLAKEVKAAR